VHGDANLTKTQLAAITASESDGIGISAISLWEVAKLVERKRLTLPCEINEWFEQALNYPGDRVLELTPEVVIASTQLPGEFHRDPADQIIVATARVHECKLVTSDEKIVHYPHIETVS
jgi:PIN domain nuclease of toxin-antitoxin system